MQGEELQEPFFFLNQLRLLFWVEFAIVIFEEILTKWGKNSIAKAEEPERP